MQTAIVLDIHSLYCSIGKKFPDHVLNYVATLDLFKDYNVVTKVAYGRQTEKRVVNFANMLKRLGFELRFGEWPYDLQMGLECADMISTGFIDTLVLGGDTVDILKYAQRQNIKAVHLSVDPNVEHSNQTFVIDTPLLQPRK